MNDPEADARAAASSRRCRCAHQLTAEIVMRAGMPVPRFELKGETGDATAPRVLTGHAEGTITLNIAEADDAERERMEDDVQALQRQVAALVQHIGTAAPAAGRKRKPVPAGVPRPPQLQLTRGGGFAGI